MSPWAARPRIWRGNIRSRGWTSMHTRRAASIGRSPPRRAGFCPARRGMVDRAGPTLAEIDRFEINEAFGAQVMACARELGIDENKLNVNGGAIALGHPLAATGVRLSVTLARELKRSRTRYGIAS